MKTLSKVLNIFDATICVLLMLFIFIDVSLQISSRIIPGAALPWTVELGQIFLAGIIWMGISMSVNDDSHVSFDILSNRLKPKSKKIIAAIDIVIFIIYMLLLTGITINLVQFYIQVDARTTVLKINYGLARLPIIVGCVVTTIKLLMKLCGIFKSFKSENI
jgi:TRAP-type C4-dicarboxylate transport system permease small subunit